TLDARRAVAGVEALPLVRRAEVVRAFPNRVTLLVEERHPSTLVNAGSLYWVDEQGVPLGPETRAVSVDAPLISGVTAADVAAAGRMPSERVATGVALLRTLMRAQSSLLSEISEVDVSRPEGPVLFMLDGVEVRIGSEDWDGRLGRLGGVLAQLRASGQTVTSVDLRFRDQVVLKTAKREGRPWADREDGRSSRDSTGGRPRSAVSSPSGRPSALSTSWAWAPAPRAGFARAWWSTSTPPSRASSRRWATPRRWRGGRSRACSRGWRAATSGA